MLVPNTLLNGRYRVEKLVGQGGMGAVYKARAEHLHMTVAVKEATVSDSNLVVAFEREARRLARLRHPALPRVIDHFDDHGHSGHYLVMEFIEGKDLGEKLLAKGEPLSVDEVLALGDQLLQVLEYLHEQQPPIIHRDIKPQNIKVMPNGFLILLDFGLTKGGVSEQNSNGSRSLFGDSLGYAPLEQIKGQGTDQRSDLYSVGATLWTLLTAQPAIHAQAREQAAKHGEPDPMRPADELNPQVPPLVAQLITNALALNPNQRPNSATEMRQQLHAEAERKLEEAESSKPPSPPVVADPVATASDAGLPKRVRAVSPSTTPAPQNRLSVRIMIGLVVVILVAIIVFLTLN
ncbi:MAG: serine/threonine protein kinase [Ardenticatenaceae bacterium]